MLAGCRETERGGAPDAGRASGDESVCARAFHDSSISPHALLPLRLLASRDRSGAYLIMLCVGTALFGMFFFLTVFVQAVWGYSALLFRTGVAYLPMMAAIMAMSAASAQLVPRIGARPLLIAGSATAAGGMSWLSRISEHSHYATGMLGPTLVTGAGLGMLFAQIGEQVVAGFVAGYPAQGPGGIGCESRPEGVHVTRPEITEKPATTARLASVETFCMSFSCWVIPDEAVIFMSAPSESLRSGESDDESLRRRGRGTSASWPMSFTLRSAELGQ